MTPTKLQDEYHSLKASGMFWEYYPTLTGDWQLDKDKFTEVRLKHKAATGHLGDALDYYNHVIAKPFPNAIKPNYYRRTIKGVEIDVIDIIQAFGLNFCLGNVLKYCLRAGQKDGNSKEQDLKKAAENINRELNGHL